MGFVKTAAELDAYYAEPVRVFPTATMAGVMFGAGPERTQALLPPPLEQADMPGGLIFIAEYGPNNLGAGYREAALFLRCRYRGQAGSYCLSMPIDSSPDRLHNGRDIFGFPKKAARIHFERDGNGAAGWVERLGRRFLELRVNPVGTLPALPPQGPTFLFKASPRIDLQPGFDGPVLLASQQTEIAPRSIAIGPAEVTLRDAPADPWTDIGEINVLMAFVIESTNRMLPGKILDEVDGDAFLPHYFKMTDFGAGEA